MFPAYLKPVSRYFREHRNRPLVALIDELAAGRGGMIDVIDVGGSIEFWLGLPRTAREKCRTTLLNLPGEYDSWPASDLKYRSEFTVLTGDARDLSQFSDGAFDLAVCNSVIEHVGAWRDMQAAAHELTRVGKRGWVQVPAFEFPLEQHFLVPFVHWFAGPVQRKVLSVLHGNFRRRSFAEQQTSVDHTRPLTRGELQELFPDARVASEWLVLPKSHIAMW